MASGRRPLNERFREPFYSNNKTEHSDRYAGENAQGSFIPDETDLMLYGGRDAEPLHDNVQPGHCLPERITNLDTATPFVTSSPSSSSQKILTECSSDTFQIKTQAADRKARDLESIIKKFSELTDRISQDSKDDATSTSHQLPFTSDDFLPPLDSMLMFRSPWLQRDRFIDEVQVGDVFCCSVMSVGNSGLHTVLLCYACGKSREIDQLKIPAYCSSRDIPELLYSQKKEVADIYSVKDKVVGVVVRLKEASEDIQVSLVERDLPFNLQGHVKLGLIRSEELPPSYKTMCTSSDLTYGQILLTKTIFHSEGVTTRMTGPLGLRHDLSNCSLLERVRKESIDPSETAIALRKRQSRAHALRSVVQGVKLYKEGKQMEAMTMYNKALDTDMNNVEALVARGALYANNESYRRALEDFRDALKVEPHHQNALKYTVETLLAYARDLRDTDDITSAIDCYKEVLKLDASNVSALECLASISAAKVSTADQQPLVTSTRSDLSSPMKQRSWESLESPKFTQDYEVGHRSPSVNRRRKSIMRDRHTSGRDDKSEMIHNEERSVALKRHARRSISESSSSSRGSYRHSRLKKRQRHSSSSSHSSSSNDSYLYRKRSHKTSAKKSHIFKHRRSRSSNISKYDRHQDSQTSLSISSLSTSVCQTSSKRKSKKSRRKSHSEENNQFTREIYTRKSSGNKSNESSSKAYLRAFSRTPSRSPEKAHKKAANREPRRDASRLSKEGASKKSSASSNSQSEALQSFSAKEDRRASRDKSDMLDRYDTETRKPAGIDLFGNRATDMKHEQRKDEKQSSAAPPFPYFLSTDPVRKGLAKPLTGKSKGGCDKAMTNFVVQAERGQRKAFMQPVVAYSESSSSLNTYPSVSDAQLARGKDFIVTNDVSDCHNSLSSHSYSRSRSNSSSSYYSTRRGYKKGSSQSVSRNSLSSPSHKHGKSKSKSERASRSRYSSHHKLKRHEKSRSKSTRYVRHSTGGRSRSRTGSSIERSCSTSRERTLSRKSKRHSSTSRSNSEHNNLSRSRSRSRNSTWSRSRGRTRSRSSKRSQSRYRSRSRSAELRHTKHHRSRSYSRRSYSSPDSYSRSTSSRKSRSRRKVDSKQKSSAKKSAKARKVKQKSSTKAEKQIAISSVEGKSSSKTKSKVKSADQAPRKVRALSLADLRKEENYKETLTQPKENVKTADKIMPNIESKVSVGKKQQSGDKKEQHGAGKNAKSSSCTTEAYKTKKAEQEKELQEMEDFLATLKKKKTEQ
ncbi:tetratricopeptide repeat protein 14-like [Watersipora subatra]|uniref:tetratricopeptide repeat protein 14-like n=1 Tax=Watersipora subatra TaxID=2589382 RepID=UPI00355B0E26